MTISFVAHSFKGNAKRSIRRKYNAMNTDEKQAMRIIIQIKSRYLTNSALFVFKAWLHGPAVIGLFKSVDLHKTRHLSSPLRINLPVRVSLSNHCLAVHWNQPADLLSSKFILSRTTQAVRSQMGIRLLSVPSHWINSKNFKHQSAKFINK